MFALVILPLGVRKLKLVGKKYKKVTNKKLGRNKLEIQTACLRRQLTQIRAIVAAQVLMLTSLKNLRLRGQIVAVILAFS